MIEILAQRLLGAHVAGGSEHWPLLGLLHSAVVPNASVRFLRQPLGQSKIQDLDLASFVQADVGRLDVTVHDPAGMGGVQSVGHLGGQIDDLRDFEPSLFPGPNPATRLR